MAAAETQTQNRARRGQRRAAGAIAAALGACAICCAGPLLAVLGGLSIASLAASVWIPALAVVAAAAAAAVVVVLRRRRRATCSTGASTVDLGMPTPAKSGSEDS